MVDSGEYHISINSNGDEISEKLTGGTYILENEES